MANDLAVLVVDVCQAWEDVLKSNARGYRLDFNCFTGKFVEKDLPKDPEKLFYQYGSHQAGFDAIVDTVRIAHLRGIPIYSVHFYKGWTDGEEQTAYALDPYIPAENRSEKGSYSAFYKDYLNLPNQVAFKLKEAGFKRLLILGYDRDCCVLKTCKDAVTLGYEVITSEHCMLHHLEGPLSERELSIQFYKNETKFIESLADLWNWIREN